MSSIFQRLYDFFENRKNLLFGLMVALIVACVFLISRITLEEDISKIMPSDEGISAINEVFENSDFTDRLVILISDKNLDSNDRQPIKDYSETFANKIAANIDSSLIRDFIPQVDQGAFQSIFDELFNHIPLFLEEEDYEIIADRIQSDSVRNIIKGIYKSLLVPGSGFIKKYAFRDPLGMTTMPLERLQAFRYDENFIIDDGYLMTKDGRHLLLFINPAESSKETKNNSRLIRELDNVIGTMPQNKFAISYFGGVAVAVENAHQIRRDVTLTVSVAAIALLSLLFFFFRRLSTFFFLVIPTLLGGLCALAILTLCRGEVSIISIGIGSVLLGITLDYSLHVFTHYRKTSNTRQGLSDLSTSILVSSITTATAFLCLFFIRSEALHDLGFFAAVSVLFSAFFSLVVLPHLLPKKLIRNTSTFIDKLADFRTRYPRFLFLVILGMTVFFSCFITNVSFEDDLNKVNYMSEKLTEAEVNLSEITDVVKRGVMLLTKGNSLDEALTRAESIKERLTTLQRNEKIAGVVSVSAFLPTKIEQDKRIDRWNKFWTIERRSQTIELFADAAAEMGIKAQAFRGFERQLNKRFASIDLDQLDGLIDVVFAEFISARNSSSTVLTIARVNENQINTVYDNLSSYEDVHILDKSYLISRFIDVLKRDFDKLVLWSLILIFFILHGTYGSFELAIITFLPIAISWIWTLGIMHWFDLKFNIVNIIITSFIFGLGIDYSIFIMRGLLQRYQLGQQHLATYKTSIIMSALTTLIGIGVMIVAKHPALRSIASVSVIGISSVVILAFTIQPLLFSYLVYSRRHEKRLFPLTILRILRTIIFYTLLIIGIPILAIARVISTALFHPLMKKHAFIERIRYHYAKIVTLPIQGFAYPQFPALKDKLKIAYHNPAELMVIRSGLPNANLAFWPEENPSLVNWLCRPFFHISNVPIPNSVFLSFTNVRNNSMKNIESVEDCLNWRLLDGDKIMSRDHCWIRENKTIIQAYPPVNSPDSKPCEASFYRHRLFDNYRYKGSVLWFYMLVKVRLEKYYEIFHRLTPKKGLIVDIGCGYGFMSYMLHLLSSEREIIGIDYDVTKINTARHAPERNNRINFIATDLRDFNIPEADAFIVADVFHYLPRIDQKPLFDALVYGLKPGGVIIIRDGDADIEARHGSTKWTEIFSTGLGFNKTKNQLNFISSSTLKNWASDHKLIMAIEETSDKTSNSIFTFRRQSH